MRELPHEKPSSEQESVFTVIILSKVAADLDLGKLTAPREKP